MLFYCHPYIKGTKKRADKRQTSILPAFTSFVCTHTNCVAVTLPANSQIRIACWYSYRKIMTRLQKNSLFGMCYRECSLYFCLHSSINTNNVHALYNTIALIFKLMSRRFMQIYFMTSSYHLFFFCILLRLVINFYMLNFVKQFHFR